MYRNSVTANDSPSRLVNRVFWFTSVATKVPVGKQTPNALPEKQSFATQREKNIELRLFVIVLFVCFFAGIFILLLGFCKFWLRYRDRCFLGLR